MSITTTTADPATIEPGGELRANLQRHADQARGAYATNTERALRADIVVFSAWCTEAEVTPLPASPATVAGFIDAMGELKAPATVRRYLSSIATFHGAARLPNPCAAIEVKLALKRLHRGKGRVQAQARPLNRALIERMLQAAGDAPRDLRNRALLAVAYDTLCRRSELAELRVEDLELGADGSGTVTIRRSKTDQEGAGMVRYLAADTMRHLAAWRSAAGLEAGALFRAVGKAGRVGGRSMAARSRGSSKAWRRRPASAPTRWRGFPGTAPASAPPRTWCGMAWNCRR